jgi:hypothetical protein
MTSKLINQIAIALLFIFIVVNAKAQIIPSYTFSQNTSGTYSAITGGTILGSGTGLDNERYAVTLPFNFNLDNVIYTNIYVCANGYISFGTTDPGASNYAAINSTTSGYAAACGYSMNLASLNATTELRYEILGSAPNRTFVAQWKNFGYPSITNLNVSFQVRLQESGYAISVIYGSMAMNGTTTGQVGLRGTSNSIFNTRQSTTGWTNTTSGTNASQISLTSAYTPSSGLTYTFTPPLCTAPTSQPTALVLTQGINNVNVAYTAALPAVSKYLVVRTPGIAALSSNPVNSTAYAAGNTIGNGTVVYAGSAVTSNNTGLNQNTYYTYTVFGYNDGTCLGGPLYNTVTPLVGTIQTDGPRIYTWLPTSGAASFNTASNWSPARISLNGGDTLNFSNGGTVTVTDVPGQTVGVVQVSNGNFTFDAQPGNSTVYIDLLLKVNTGCTLTLGDVYSFTLQFTSGSHTNIDGILNLNGSTVYTGINGNTDVTGTIGVTATAALTNGTATGTNLNFLAGSVYNHARDGGSIPLCTMNTAATTNITGVVATAPTVPSAMPLGNLVWNCSSQTIATASFGTSTTIGGSFTVANTNNHILKINSGNLIVSGDFIQTGGIFQITTASNQMLVAGNMTLTAGTLDISGATSSTITPLHLSGNITQGVAHTITKTGTGIPNISFEGTTHQTFTIGGTSANVPINYVLNNAAGATLYGILSVGTGGTNTLNLGRWDGNGSFGYSGTSTLQYVSAFPLSASSVEWPATGGPSNVLLNLTGPEPINRVYMPGSRQISLITFTMGVLVLGPYDLTTNSIGGNFYANDDNSKKMIAADSTGQLKRVINPVSSSTAFEYPIGSIRDTAVYSPMYFNMTSNSVSRLIGVNVKDHVHPNISSSNYLNRYWTFSDNMPSSTCTYKFIVDLFNNELVGNPNIRMNRWNGATWTQLPGTYTGFNYYYFALSIDNPLTSNTDPIDGMDFTGRTSVANTYYWTGAVNMDYQVAGNWTPSRNTPDPTDKLIFNSGNSDTVKNVPTQNITSITITNNTIVCMQGGAGSGNRDLTLTSDYNPTTNELSIDNGSTLILNGTIAPLRLLFDAGTINDCIATIAGRLEIINTTQANVMSFGGCLATVTSQGVLAAGTTNGTNCFLGTTVNLVINGTYEHKYTTTGGYWPQCTWGSSSYALIKGYTVAPTFILNTTGPINRLVYNCPLQTSLMNAQFFTNVTDSFIIVSTGTGQFRLGTNTYNYQVNHFIQTGGYFDLSTVANTVIQNFAVSGSLIQTGGTFLCSGVGTATNTLKFNGTTAAQNVSFRDAAPSGRIQYSIINPLGINLSGSGSLTTNFNINSNGGIIIATNSANPINTPLNLVYDPVNSTLTYAANANCVATTNVFPISNGPQNLTINMPPGTKVSIPFSRTVPSTLKMTAGDIDLGASTLTLGISAAATGTLTWTAGNIKLSTGSFSRWYGVSGLPTSPGTIVGYYPVANGTNDNRNVSVYFNAGTALTTGGTISISHNDNPGATGSLSIPDGTATIVSRANPFWTFTTGNGIALASASSVGMRLTGGNMFNIASPSGLHTMNQSSVIGIHVAGSGTTPNFMSQRFGLALNDLTAGNFYIGAEAAIGNIFISVANGNWNTGSTWNLGTVPGAGDVVIIANNTTVATNGSNAAKFVTVAVGGTLSSVVGSLTLDSALVNNGTVLISGGTITLGPSGGGKIPFANNDSLNVSSGYLTVNGNLANAAGSSFTQSGGEITIDGNAGGVLANSVAAATPLMSFNSAQISATGGILRFIDPHVGTTATAYTMGSSLLAVSPYDANIVFSPNHSTIFGDGISTTPGGSANGFNLNLYIFSSIYSNIALGNVIINGSPSGANRQVQATNSLTLNGNLTLNNANAEFNCNTHLLITNGNITANAGTFFDASGGIYFEDGTTDNILPATAPQTVSGAGTFRNLTAAPTANFTGLLFNNSSASGVTFQIGDFSYSSSLVFTLGKIIAGTGNNTISQIGTGTVTNASPSTGWIVGKFSRAIPATFTSKQFPIGTMASYTPINITSSANAVGVAGTLKVSVTNGDHPAIGSSVVLPNKSVNRYFTIERQGGLSFSPNSVMLSAGWVGADVDAGASYANFVGAFYNNSAWISPGIFNPTAYSIIASGLGNNIEGNFQVGEVNPTLLVLQHPATQTICSGTNANFSVTTINSTGIFYQWQLLIGATWTDISASSTYGGVTTNTLTILNAGLSLNNGQYRCRVYTASDVVYSNPATLTVGTTVAPTISIAANPGNTICANGSVTFTATITNGGSTPVYQWKVNGINAGAGGSSFTTTTLLNSDVVTCLLTSSSSCAIPSSAPSNAITMTVNPNAPASVTITATPGLINCAGTSLTFTATPVNGGTAPAYQWKKNNVNVGTNSATYTDNALANNDAITCVFTSNQPCVTSATATSNTLTMTVNPIVTPTVSITANPGSTICASTPVIFNATITNGGTTPAYQWKKNNVNVGTNSASYTDNGLVNNDVITCVLTSNAGCASTTTATSNAITITVSGSLVPSVSIAANPGNTICAGSTTTFTATPTNGGTTPAYQWKKNNINIGTNSASYTDNSLITGDVLTCVMTTSATCATVSTATSAGITMTVNPVVVPSATIAANPGSTICPGTSVAFTITPVNGGTSPSYQWKKNNVNVATNSTTYTDAGLVNSDAIECVMTGSATCASVTTVNSNTINMTVNPVVTPSVSITVTPGAIICSGSNVTFNATPANGGGTPQYQWKLNGTNISLATSASYSTPTIANGDVITCQLTSNAACASTTIVLSNAITMTVTPSVTPAITILANSNPVCAGTVVVFTSAVTNGGTAPTYQWKKNGVSISLATNATYSSSTLLNNDIITCELTSNAGCASPAIVLSTGVTMTVNPVVTPAISISANPGNTICVGTSVTFTAVATNGGSTPAYQWKKNGINAGTNSAAYIASGLATGDVITCVLTGSASCATAATATSNGITMTVTAPVTPSVSILASPGNAICSGTQVTFTATAINGGTAPQYQWKKNGLNVGTNNAVYIDNTLANADIILCELTSSNTCVTAVVATSNSISMTVTPSVTPSVTASANPGTTINLGTQVVFTATVINGGSSPTYKWQKNSVAIPGETNSTYTTTTLVNNDNINVVVHSNAACASPDSAVSNIMLMHVNTDVKIVSGNIGQIELYPNPNTGYFRVNGTVKNQSKSIWLTVVNLHGQNCFSKRSRARQ